VKLRPRSFQIFWDAHAWAGVVASLFLYVMFFMGAFALFHPEINVWAEPRETRPTVVARPLLQPLLAQLEREHGVMGAQRVAFMPERTGLRAYVSKPNAFAEFRYSPESERLERPRSELGSFLYELHYLGPLPYGIYFAGVCSMALLLALVSGLFIHFEDLRRQWFQFRPERVTRTWTSDLHKVLGVFGLPYQLLYAWTGAVLALGYPIVEPLFENVAFGGDPKAVAVARGDSPEAIVAATGQRTGALPDIDALVAMAERRVPGLHPTWIGLEHVGDAASTLSLSGDAEGTAFGAIDVVMRVSDGALLSARGPANASVYQRFESWFFGLHYARFGGYGLELLYALLAFGSCAVIATGNLVWLERRDLRRARPGHRILARLTAGVCAGVVLATAGAFLGNRLLPAELPNRAAAEPWVFWCTLVPAAVLPLIAGRPRRVASLELLLAGALFMLVVAIDVVTRRSSLESPIHAAVLGGLALLGGASLLGGIGLWRPRGAPSSSAPRSVATPGASRAGPAPPVRQLEPDPAHHEPR
jgi:uncharacterized iron-regulated membrane protein